MANGRSHAEQNPDRCVNACAIRRSDGLAHPYARAEQHPDAGVNIYAVQRSDGYAYAYPYAFAYIASRAVR